MRSYRVLAAILLVALGGLILAGCGPKYDQAVYGRLDKVDPSNQKVTFWYQHTGEKHKAMQALIDDFNRSNQWGITVDGKSAGSYAEIYDKVMWGIPMGTVPDIAVAYQNQAAMYATHKAVVELTPYTEDGKWGFSKAVLANDFFPFVKQGDVLPQFNGRYGFATQRSMEVLYYNEDWLHKLGYKNPPATWDEFASMACAASDSAAGTSGYEMAIDASTFADMVFNHGGTMVDGNAKAYTFGDSAGLAALTDLQKLFHQGCAVLEKDSDDDQKAFGDGRVLFIISSTSNLPTVRDAVGKSFNWSVSTLPSTLPSARANIYGASLSIFRSTPEKQLAAWLFIKWLTEPDQGARWTQATDYFPVRQSTKERLAGYFAGNPQFAKAFGFLRNDIAIEPGVVGYDFCRNKIGPMLNAGAAGADLPAWLAKTVQECNTFLPQGPSAPKQP